MIDGPHKGHEFFVDATDDLFAGIERAENSLTQAFFRYAFDEFVGDSEIDVAVEKRFADLTQPVANIRFGESAPAAQLLEGLAEALLNTLEHERKPNTPSPIDSMS